MSRKSIGIIGITGRVGSLVADVVSEHRVYSLGASFSRSKKGSNLKEVFTDNDYVVDFSSAAIIRDILIEANLNPKPLILCTTGWNASDMEEDFIKPLALKVPIVITPNTSIGTSLQLYLAKKVASLLGAEYNIHINEKHHKHKKDSPSGTAKALAKCVDADNSIISSERIGDNPGEHEICFTSKEEMISIKHIAFTPLLFAKRVIHIIDWFERRRPAPGVYSMLDVLELNQQL